MRFSIWVEDETAIPAAGDVIREHMSACASDTDNPIEFADEVTLSHSAADPGFMVFGYLDRVKSAPYFSMKYVDPREYEFVPWEPA